MLPVVFEEFEMVYMFLLSFFSLSLSIGKRSTIAKIWGETKAPHSPEPPGVYGPVIEK